MQPPFKSLLALLERKAVIRLLVVILLAAGAGVYWHLSHRQEIEMLNVGGRGNACICTQRLNQ